MNTATIFFLAYFLEFLIDNVDEEFEAKKNNTLLSGKKIIFTSAAAKIIFYRFN